jgi:PTH1 family peptidyl-tRNA hydrolase
MNFQAELSFFEPYFLNADTSLMSRLYFRDLGSYQVPLAIEQRVGLEATAMHNLKCNEHLRSTFSLGLENINLKEGDFNRIRNMYAAHHIPISERARELSDGLFFNITPGLVYDSRDTNMNPRSGVLASLRFEESLGVTDFEKTNGRLTGMARKYIPVLKKSALSFTAKGGMKIHGDEMPEVMAYKLGGPYSIRGFKINGVGTGEAFIMGSAELTTPIPFFDRLKFKSLCGEVTINGVRALVLKPQTFMNLSGEAILEAAQFYKIAPENIIVISDDASFEPGKVRIRKSGSAGGHNGLKNIIENLSSDKFPRIKIGVGSPAHPQHEMIDWVLGTFNDEDGRAVTDAIKRASQAVEVIINNGVEAAAGKFNSTTYAPEQK